MVLAIRDVRAPTALPGAAMGDGQLAVALIMGIDTPSGSFFCVDFLRHSEFKRGGRGALGVGFGEEVLCIVAKRVVLETEQTTAGTVSLHEEAGHCWFADVWPVG